MQSARKGARKHRVIPRLTSKMHIRKVHIKSC
nr:MAG TPA: hypothetical protein [Ackermannviridae sp.]